MKGSLVYKQQRNSLTANVTIDIQFTARDNKTEPVPPKRISRQIVSKDKAILQSRDIENFTYKQQVPPGNYEVSVTIQDSNSTEVYIPKTGKGEYTLSDIRLFIKKKDSTKWNQLSGYHIPGAIDSLRFVFQVISPQTDTEMTLNARLVEYKSDTALPRRITRRDYNSSAIEYKGVDFDEDTELQSNKRVLTDYGNVFLEYKFANPDRGNYRFEVWSIKDDDEQFRGRSFGVKSEHFPAVQSVQELARPLYYLMNGDEYEELIENSDPDSLKKAIDRFWLKNIGNKRKTQQVINGTIPV